MSRASVLSALADAVLGVRAPRPVRVGIDGRSAAGKSTLARELARQLESVGRSCACISIDDFHPPGYVERAIAGDFTPESYPYEGYDLDRFRRKLEEPLDAIRVVEAAYLFLPELRDGFELTIWLEIDFDTMLARAEKRDIAWLGSVERVRERYRKHWIPRHGYYEATYRPRDRADIVVDNTDPQHPRILRTRAFYCLSSRHSLSHFEEVMSDVSMSDVSMQDVSMSDVACAASDLSLAQLAAEICCLAGHINAASYRWLALVAELDRRRGWADDLAQSCAHWLGWKCGVALGAAREKVRVARALERLPKTSAAMASGRLSYSKVREITRVASAETEEFLLQIAEHGTAQHIESFVRAYRRSQQAEELSREASQRRHRFLGFRYGDDGSLVVQAQLPAEIGALFVRAIEAAVAQLPAEPDVPAGTSEASELLRVRRADALGMLAESFLGHAPNEVVGADRHQVVVHVDAETLREGTAGRCAIERGPALAVETARRLGCDASVVAIVENARGEPLDVGRKTRTISTPLRRLLRARDRGCRFPGCANDRHVDAHHIQHWADGGETKPSNLVSLCRFHHREVHEGGVRIAVLDDGALRFARRDGVDVEVMGYMQPRGSWSELRASHERAELPIDADTAVTRWCGERLDHGLAVEMLLQLAPASSCVPAGT